MAKARFEVSTEGMRELQSGREPWQLAKELIANAWDETTTKCEVVVKSLAPRKALLSVYDDGGGFATIEDAWTLMGHTPKRGEPNVRGRFNIGEKEILSVAIDAAIYTSGKIITFPKSGGRQVRTNGKMLKGTRVDCHLPWGNRQVETVESNLKRLLTPKGIEYTVNGEAVPYREPEDTTESTLETVIQKSAFEPMTSTFRRTQIELYQAEQGMLYEMGIPIQKIDCPYMVNVMQKVPMPPNRDVVKDSYLKDIYAAVLNRKHEEVTDISASWVRMAIENKCDIQAEVVKAIMQRRYTDKAILWSTNTIANERALEHGYEIIHGRTLSEGERKAFEDVGLVHTSDIFAPQPEAGETIPLEEWTSGMNKIAGYTRMLAKELLGMDVGVQMYRLKGDIAGATWQAGVVSFNVLNLGTAWFDRVTPNVTGVILHELAHHRGNGHDPMYLDSLRGLAGEAVHFAARDFTAFWDYSLEHIEKEHCHGG